tara:strand:+ start:379 stop:753 length:375 start_codon:yes stop_codon:yes gene_type:complete
VVVKREGIHETRDKIDADCTAEKESKKTKPVRLGLLDFLSGCGWLLLCAPYRSLFKGGSMNVGHQDYSDMALQPPDDPEITQCSVCGYDYAVGDLNECDCGKLHCQECYADIWFSESGEACHDN